MARTERPVPPAAAAPLRELRSRARAYQRAVERCERLRLLRDDSIRESVTAGAPTRVVADAACLRRSQIHNITGGESS